MFREILWVIKTIKECRKEGRNLVEYIERDLSKNKDAHIIHLNRYFYLLSGLGSKLEHRFDKKELSSVYSLCGVDVEFNSPKCLGGQPFKVLAKND
jgi:hypothetical protein